MTNSDFKDYLTSLRKTAKSDCSLRHVCPSVVPSGRMEQPGSHWTDIYEIWYLGVIRKLSKNSSFIKIWQEKRMVYM